MQRRGFLTSLGVGALGVAGGCTSTKQSTESPSPAGQDTDGDGVVDGRDYAPKDADVQKKSDVLQETQTPTITPTRSPSPTPTASPTPSPTPTATPERYSSNVVTADSGALRGVTHHLIDYSSQHVKVRLYGDQVDRSYTDGADVIAVVQGYPGTSRSDEVLDHFRSDSFHPPSSGETTVTVDFGETVSSDVPLYYWLVLVPAGKDMSSIDGSEVEMLCQSDRLGESGGDVYRSRHSREKGDVSTDRYTRAAAEGSYLLEFSGDTYWQPWNVGFIAYKHGYIDDIYGTRYSDRRRYVYEALNQGLADEFGRVLDEEAEANEITAPREKVEFLIDFVQNLPYIPDDVSTGYDDYTKRHIETLVDGGGDCEDSSIMLASLLLSEPFNYGTALILLPGHMALGVMGGEDIDGVYYEKDGERYYYVETTGRGWDVGEMPEEYRDEDAYVYVL